MITESKLKLKKRGWREYVVKHQGEEYIIEYCDIHWRCLRKDRDPICEGFKSLKEATGWLRYWLDNERDDIG